jgi:Putative ER transporter, 6TM, N-terminal
VLNIYITQAEFFHRVCAIWLFANIWFVNVLRAKMPALQFPVILYSIFTNVAFTFGPLFPTIASGGALIKQLLEGFLTAFAISTGVSLFIIPVSSRTVVFKEQTGYIQLIRATLKAQTAYLQSLETSDMFAPKEPAEDGDGKLNNGDKTKKSKKKDQKSHPAANAQAVALKANLTALTSLHGRLHGDMSFGKRETAWGKLDAKDLDEIFTLFRAILIPLIGMSTITDIFERIAERRGWVQVPNSRFDKAEAWEECGPEEKEREKKSWNEIMKTLHEPFEVVRIARHLFVLCCRIFSPQCMHIFHPAMKKI